MRYLSILSFVLIPALVFADTRTPRPVDPLAAEALDRAMAQSAIVRSLVATLESSNVIVHIESSRELPRGIGGTTRFVTARGGFRYVRVTISADLQGRTRAIILGHELRHAVEVAESTAHDLAGVRRLFEHAGHRLGDYYETRAAIETERSIRTELTSGTARLRSGQALQAEPVVKFDP
jgi:hypothetical protein